MDWHVNSMTMFCIPPNMVEKLKESALKGSINLKELSDMSSAERRKFFAGHTNPALGKFINTEFEKALVSNQKAALTDWATSVFKAQAKKGPAYKNMLDKINSLDEIGALDPTSKKAFLEDLVSDKLGISPSPEEVRLIAQQANKIDEAQLELGDNLGSPEHVQDNLKFFSAKKEMDDYLQKLSPASKLRVTTGTIGRGLMLASIKSPILNIGSNIEVGLTEIIARRLSGGGIKSTDNQLAKDYIKMVNEVYKKTGYDLSRMTSLADNGASGGRVLDDVVHSQGKGAVRAVGRAVEDVVFKRLMGGPDVKFGAFHFADSVNKGALVAAKGDKNLAKSIMGDAMRLEPQTFKGQVLRDQGILDAQFATWTNKSWATNLTLGIRKLLNDGSGNLRAGDYLMPFVKTPANVISTGLDYAGMGIPKAMFKAVKAIRSGEIGEKAVTQSIMRDIVRAGLGITGATILAANITPDNFIGAYDPKRKQIEELRNSNTNSVKIGNKWISLDWFGPLSIPLTASLYAKKYGKDTTSGAFEYGKGAGSVFLNLPGVKEVGKALKDAENNKGETLGEASGGATNYLLGEISSRFVPSILSDIARAIDPYERKPEKGMEGIQAKIPGARESLPIKKNVFGEAIEAEDPISRILFGSRVKTSKDDATIKEISRVADVNDKGITFTDWDKSNSKILSQFRDKVGQDKYDEAKGTYGRALKAKLETSFNGQDYKKLDEMGKLKFINDQDTKIMGLLYKKYGFKYKQSD